MTTVISERLHALDALRAGALLLGVVLHAAIAWMPGASLWWVVGDADPSRVPGLVFFVVHMFRMTLFFLLAGFFARAMLERRGLRGFVVDRARRVVLPLAAAWPIVMTLFVLVFVLAGALAPEGPKAPPPPPPRFTPDDFPLGHLWFLWLLVLFYATALGVRGVSRAIGRMARPDRMGIAAVRIVSGPLGPLLLAVPTACALATHAGWMPWFGIPTPDRALIPNLPAFVAYGTAFTAGWLAQRDAGTVLARWCAAWPWHLVLGMVAITTCLALLGTAPSGREADTAGFAAACAIAYAVGAFALPVASAGLVLRFMAGESRVRRYVADASYWIYLVHLPVVMAVQVGFAQVAWPWWIEWPATLAVAGVVLFGSYAVVVRDTRLGAFLDGGRRRRSAAVTAAG